MVQRHPHRVERAVELGPHEDERPQATARSQQAHHLERRKRHREACQHDERRSAHHARARDRHRRAVRPQRRHTARREGQRQGDDTDRPFEQKVIEHRYGWKRIVAKERCKPSAVEPHAEKHEGNSRHPKQHGFPSIDEPLLRLLGHASPLNRPPIIPKKVQLARGLYRGLCI